MIVPFGFFSGYGRPMTEPANVRTNPDAPAASQATTRTSDVPITAPRLNIPWQRYPQATRNRVVATDVAVVADPAAARAGVAPQRAVPAGLPPGIAMPARPMYLPFRPRMPMPQVTPAPGGGGGGRSPGGRAPRIPGGSALLDTTGASAGGGGGGGAVDAGGGAAPAGSSLSAVPDADLIAFLDAAAAGQLPDDLKPLLPEALGEAGKRGLPIPAALVGTSSSAPPQGAAKAGGGIGLAVAGAGAGFLVAGPIGAAVGAAAGLLLGRK